MRKILSAVCTGTLFGAFIIFPSCDREYEEEDECKCNIYIDELMQDMQERAIEFSGDIIYLPFKSTQLDSITYTFEPSGKEKMMKSLFLQTAKLSKYGNFNLTNMSQYFEYGVSKLEDSIVECEVEDDFWYFVGRKGDYINLVMYYEVNGKPCLKISRSIFPLDENGVVLAPK